MKAASFTCHTRSFHHPRCHSGVDIYRPWSCTVIISRQQTWSLIALMSDRGSATVGCSWNLGCCGSIEGATSAAVGDSSLSRILDYHTLITVHSGARFKHTCNATPANAATVAGPRWPLMIVGLGRSTWHFSMVVYWLSARSRLSLSSVHEENRGFGYAKWQFLF